MKPNQGQLDKDLKCPHCGSKADGYTYVGKRDDAAPRTGDVCVCLYCHRVNVYHLKDGKYTFTIPTKDELKKMLDEIPELMKAIMATRVVMTDQQKKYN
jgi:hypothetical protein